MRDILLFAIGASVVGTVFFVSLIELIFTVKRRKTLIEIEKKAKEMKAQFNDSINQMTLAESTKMQEADAKIEALNQQINDEKARLEQEYQTKMKEANEIHEDSLRKAKERARKMHQEAEKSASEYLSNRRREVEQELVQLVISVSKKVLPADISYEAQKELVMRALHEIKKQ